MRGALKQLQTSTKARWMPRVRQTYGDAEKEKEQVAHALDRQMEEKVAVAALINDARQPATVVVKAVMAVVGEGVVLRTKRLWWS